LEQVATEHRARQPSSLANEGRRFAAFVENGEIVLNISALATNRLKLGNEAVEFSARFGGVATDPAASATPEASGSRASSSAALRAARRLSNKIAGLAQLVEQPPCKR
jgi:hypothetical protein